jgi:hypothetical protein
MKHTITSKRSLSLLALATAATLTSNAHAGAPAKPVAAPAKDSSTLLAGSFLEKMTGSVDVGYDSGYYFRGLWFSNNNVWEGLTLNLPVTEQLSLTLGGIYTSSTNTRVVDANGRAMLKYSELDLIAGASYDAGFAKFGLVYTYYNFYDTFSGSTPAGTFGNTDRDSAITTSSDLGFTISKSIGPVNLNAGYWYDFRIGGQYLESSADCPIEVTSHFSVVPSVSVGYGFDYYSFAANLPSATTGPGKRDGFTAVRPALSFPIKVTETATFTPYAAMNLSGSARYNPMTASNTVEGRNDFYFGGKMSVSF